MKYMARKGKMVVKSGVLGSKSGFLAVKIMSWQAK